MQIIHVQGDIPAYVKYNLIFKPLYIKMKFY